MICWLIDTGPLVAYLDSRDPAHRAIAERLDGFSGELATTSAVITETMHFVAASREGPTLLAEFAMASNLQVHDLTRAQPLRDHP